MRLLRTSAALAAALVLASCGSANPTPTQTPSPPPTAAPAQTMPVLGLPFAAGTRAAIGPLGLHAANFRSVDGEKNGVVRLDGAATVLASLDLVADAGTAVHPVAVGTVLASWPLCDVVVVDHGGGLWSEYIHLAVAVSTGDPVRLDDTLGTVLPEPTASWTPPPSCGSLEAGVPHLHIALASGGGSIGSYAGAYTALEGTTLCGARVDVAGDLTGLGVAGGAPFTVPDCGGTAGNTVPAATPTPVPTPTPSPTPAPTPALSAAWVSPKDGAKVTASILKLSAKASFSSAAASIGEVAFTVAWGTTTKTACTAGKVSGGMWSCSADLSRLGAPLGKLKLSFTVTDGAGMVAAAPAGTRTVTYAALPGKPTALRVTLSCAVLNYCPDEPVRLTWQPGPGPLSGYRIYWNQANDACMYPSGGMSSTRGLLATVGASSRSWKGVLPPYTLTGRFVLVPYNSAGVGPAAFSEVVTNPGCEANP